MDSLTDLSILNNLTELDLSDNRFSNINDIEDDSPSSFFPNSLQKLSLARSRFKSFPNLSMNTNLIELDLDDNNIVNFFTIPTKKQREKLPPNLKKLNLRSCSLRIFPNFSAFSNLLELNLGYNNNLIIPDNGNNIELRLPPNLKTLILPGVINEEARTNIRNNINIISRNINVNYSSII